MQVRIDKVPDRQGTFLRVPRSGYRSFSETTRGNGQAFAERRFPSIAVGHQGRTNSFKEREASVTVVEPDATMMQFDGVVC